MTKMVVSDKVSNSKIAVPDEFGGGEIVTAPVKVSGIEIATFDDVVTIASRLHQIIPQPSKPTSDRFQDLTITKHDCLSISTWALSAGINPLLPGQHYHVWNSFDRTTSSNKKLNKMYHFRIWRSFAKHVLGTFLPVFEVVSDIDPEDQASSHVVNVYLIAAKDMDDYKEEYRFIRQAYMNEGAPAGDAIKLAQVDAARLVGLPSSGKVKWDEAYKIEKGEVIRKGGSTDITGWDGYYQRAQTRAVTNAIKANVGEPSFWDNVRTCFGLQDSPHLVKQAVMDTPLELHELPPEHSNAASQMIASNVRSQDAHERSSPEEFNDRVTSMRGEREQGID